MRRNDHGLKMAAVALHLKVAAIEPCSNPLRHKIWSGIHWPITLKFILNSFSITQTIAAGQKAQGDRYGHDQGHDTDPQAEFERDI